MTPPPPVLSFDSVSRSFDTGSGRRVDALLDVSLSFPAGQFAAVVGKSGSGKSTLLNLACGLDHPNSGTVGLLGRPLQGMGDDDLTILRLRHVGFVFQFFNLLPTLSAEENVALPARLAGMGAREALDRARHLLSEMGLAGRMNHRPDHLSGGEQQRTALARALINDPQVILADEPTGNLDTEAGIVVLDRLQMLAEQQGKLVVMVTHSTEALDHTHRTVRLRDGRVVEDR